MSVLTARWSRAAIHVCVYTRNLLKCPAIIAVMNSSDSNERKMDCRQGLEARRGIFHCLAKGKISEGQVPSSFCGGRTICLPFDGLTPDLLHEGLLPLGGCLVLSEEGCSPTSLLGSWVCMDPNLPLCPRLSALAPPRTQRGIWTQEQVRGCPACVSRKQKTQGAGPGAAESSGGILPARWHPGACEPSHRVTPSLLGLHWVGWGGWRQTRSPQGWEVQEEPLAHRAGGASRGPRTHAWRTDRNSG